MGESSSEGEATVTDTAPPNPAPEDIAALRQELDELRARVDSIEHRWPVSIANLCVGDQLPPHGIRVVDVIRRGNGTISVHLEGDDRDYSLRPTDIAYIYRGQTNPLASDTDVAPPLAPGESASGGVQ